MVDVVFARVAGLLDPLIEHLPAYLEPHLFLAGRKHPLSGRRRIRLTELADSVTWMPGNEPGSEWADFYVELRREFGSMLWHRRNRHWVPHADLGIVAPRPGNGSATEM